MAVAIRRVLGGAVVSALLLVGTPAAALAAAPAAGAGVRAASAAGIRFSAPQLLTSGPGSWFVVAADFNGDGKPDLAVANAASLGPDGVSLLMNTTPAGAGRASFRRCPPLATGAASPQALAVADLTGDGKPDIIVGNFATDGGDPSFPALPLLGPGIRVFVNTTAPGAACPSFAPPVDITAGVGPEVLATADLNGDGRPDLIFTDYGIPGLPQTQDVSVVMNLGVQDGQLRFSPRYSFRAGTEPLGVVTADINGAGPPDLVVSNNFSYDVSVLMNTTAPGSLAPSFAPAVNFPVASGPIGPETLAAGVLTSSGLPDIVTPNFLSGTGMSVLANTTPPGASAPSFAAAASYQPGLGPQQTAIADFTGDGRNDIAVAVQGTVALGNQATEADGVLSVFSPLHPPGSLIGHVSSGVAIYANDTPAGATQPVLAAPVWFATGDGSDSLAVADFNGDGKPDLAVANNLTAGPGGVSILMNQTPFPEGSPRR
jgi:FG-GAP repeat